MDFLHTTFFRYQLIVILNDLQSSTALYRDGDDYPSLSLSLLLIYTLLHMSVVCQSLVVGGQNCFSYLLDSTRVLFKVWLSVQLFQHVVLLKQDYKCTIVAVIYSGRYQSTNRQISALPTEMELVTTSAIYTNCRAELQDTIYQQLDSFSAKFIQHQNVPGDISVQSMEVIQAYIFIVIFMKASCAVAGLLTVQELSSFYISDYSQFRYYCGIHVHQLICTCTC